MTAYLPPWFNQQFFKSDGTVAAGCKLYTYESGTTTPKTMWTNQAGTVAHTNPITLDADGRPPSPLFFGTGEYTLAAYTDLIGSGGTLIAPPWDDVGGVGVDVQALRDDLASTTTPGASLVGIKGTSTGESGKTLSAYLNLKVKGLKANFGAVGDGATNDYAAINNAFQASGKIIEIEDGTFLCNSNIPAIACSGIVGRGGQTSIIKAGAGVTQLMTVNGSSKTLKGFQLLGNATASARGFVAGETITNLLYLDDVQVLDFTGAGAVGMDLRFVVTGEFRNLYLQGSTGNLLVGRGSSSATPTTLHFYGGAIRTASTWGAKITSGDSLGFHGTVFENNTNEGLLVQTAAGQRVDDLIVDSGAWFENNWNGYAGVTDVHDIFIDGSANASSSTSVNLSDVRLSHGSTPAYRKSVHVKKAFSTWYKLRDYYGFSNAFLIEDATSYVVVESDSSSRMATFISNPDSATVIYPIYAPVQPNGAGTGSVVPGLWQTWAPVYSTSAGNAATSFTGPGTVTTVNAQYCWLTQKSVAVNLSFSGTLNAVTPNILYATLPTGVVPKNGVTWAPCAVRNSTYTTGVVNTDGTGFLRISLDPSRPNFGSGNAVRADVSLVFEVV